MQKILFIVGPTATGKTNLALRIARKISGELVNTDSIQFYKGLDIVSGKDIPKNFRAKDSSVFLKDFQLKDYLFENVVVHLLDVVEPNYSFNLYDFVRISQVVVKDIWSRKKLPIVIGGNGFYIDSFFNEIPTISVPPNPLLRKELDKNSVEELQKILKKVDPSKLLLMNNSDMNNKRRLVRAIEVPRDNSRRKNIQTLNFESLVIGLETSKVHISKLIETRIKSRLRSGALKEAEELFKKFDSLSPQIKNAIGYKELFSYIRGEMSIEESTVAWKKAELSYVKKQITWFKKNQKIVWVDPSKKDEMRKIESKAVEWYNQTYK